MAKDYYKILGLEKGASADEIKKAFRKLAHQYHPDKQGGDEAKFKEVNEAYQILGNEQKRRQYDQFGADFDQQGGFGGGMGWEDFMRAARNQGGFQNGGAQFDFGGIDLGDILGGMFGFGGGSGRRGSRERRGNDVEMVVTLDFHEAVFGVEKDIRVTKNNACDVCGGSGREPGSGSKTCETCHGQGQVQQVQRTILGAMQTVTTCSVCHGSGDIPEKVCKHCRGAGQLRSESKYTVKIPAGIDDGEAIRLSGYGEHPGAGGQPGDLYIRVRVKEDKRFVRDGIDIHSDVHISFPQAALGSTVEIDTVDGKKQLVIPEGTQPEQRIRLKALGVPNLRGGGRGDHYVRVIVDVPKRVSRQAKKLLEDLDKELD